MSIRTIIALLAAAVLVLPWIAASPVSSSIALAALRQSEGYRLQPYRDTNGTLSVGIGHSLTAHGDRVKARYTDAEVMMFARRDLAAARRACRRGITDFDDLPEPVQVTALSVAFTCGPTGFARFTAFRAALSSRDYNCAARELETSRWATQVAVSRRADALNILRSFTPLPTTNHRFTLSTLQ